MGNFFKSVGGFLKKLFTSSSATQQISSTITLAAPLAEEIVGLVAGDAGATQATNIVGEVKADLAALASVVAGAHSTGITPTVGGQMTSIIGSLKDNLGALLTAGHIKDTNTLSKVQGVAGTLLGELSAILEVVTGSGTQTKSAAAGQ